jgi:membrane fusion protein (multidrug efflux system)
MNNAAQKTMSSNDLKPFFLTCRVLAMSLLVMFAAGCAKEEKAAPQAPEVAVVDVVQKDVPIQSEWIGTIDGMVNATIRAQVSGYLIKQNYKEGSLVKKDDVLFEIDPRPFQAALDQAQAELARSQARWDTAKANLARIRPLAKANAVSQKDLDDAVGTEQSTQAGVLAAKAAADKAKLDLEFTSIKSPIDGIAGLAAAQIGNLVGPQTADLTAVSTLDPVKVYVSISEQEYMRFAQAAPRTERRVLDLILTDGSLYPQKGEVAFADRQVDVKTGTIMVATIFPNPGNLLRPGQYARVRMVTAIRNGVLLVPQRAVSETQGQYMMAVVGADNKVSIRPVKVAERIGSDWIIEEGLKAGEKVVVEGTQKVKPDMVVVPQPFDPDAAAKAAAPAKTETKPSPAEKR